MPHPRKKPELLAPAGREAVFHAVLEAGADAVYLAGKRFNMRRHRRDFNFTDADLGRLCTAAHAAGRRFYVTVNSLVGDGELADLQDYLRLLDDINIDAIIVQDYAAIKAWNDLGCRFALHASTMMNVNSVEMARFLKASGVSRVVTSRDISLDDLRRIGEQAAVETEYFIHGDMCTVQSGQCHLSGILFGKSSNRGQCMKPCRWQWQLRGRRGGQTLAVDPYLLATKDICMAGHLPAMIEAGLSSMKIEGRMKPADILVPIVAAYREAIDRYVAEPLGAYRDPQTIGQLFDGRVRELTTGFAFGSPNAGYIDARGQREPLFLSRAGRQKTTGNLPPDFFDNKADRLGLPPADASAAPGLSVLVGTPEVAEAVLAEKPDAIIFSWEGDLRVDSAWSLGELREIAGRANALGIRPVLASPAILDDRACRELADAVGRLPEVGTILLSSPAALAALRGSGKSVWLSPALNIINPEAAEFFLRQGVECVQPGCEASFENLAAMASRPVRPRIDLQVHGPLAGMLLEHCIPAMATLGISKRDFCRMPCLHEDYAMVDEYGRERRLCTDKYCRSHLFLEHELCLLPALPAFLRLGIDSFRLDLRLADAPTAKSLTGLWRRALAHPGDLPNHLAALASLTGGAKFSYGALIHDISGDDAVSTYQIMRETRDE